jgi:hypothetical protein
MTENPKMGAIVSDNKRFWVVHDLCPPCKLIWCHSVDFVPYKSKKGNKAVVVYKRFNYSSVTLISNQPVCPIKK